jgi:hypothetical protein
MKRFTFASHLDEEERQGLADGTLSDARSATAAEHLASCPSCAADVGRLRELVRHACAHGDTTEVQPNEQVTIDALWPGIRARIESAKLVTLGGSSAAPVLRRRPWPLGLFGLAAAVLIALLVRRATDAPAPRAAAVVVPDSAPIFAADDSTTAYQREVGILLEELELRRAMLRPDVAASVDRDLAAIDRAIADLRDALKQDPNNPALRQLLAASYRQKRDLLKRVGNAS